LLQPDLKAIEQWFVRLQDRLRMPLGLPIASLAKHFNGKSYSELGEFSEHIARRMVLATPEANMKKILEKQLQLRASPTRKRRKGRA
jgi:hypothetical protein